MTPLNHLHQLRGMIIARSTALVDILILNPRTVGEGMLRFYSSLALMFCVYTFGEAQEQHDVRAASQLLRTCPSPTENGEPARMLKCINGLIDLGPSPVLAAMRESSKTRPDAIEQQKSRVLLALLFEVPPSAKHLPPAIWYDAESKAWIGTGGPLEISIEAGIPFDIVGEFQLNGRYDRIDPLIDWAAAHGKFRKEPLKPSSPPLDAADQLAVRLAKDDKLFRYRSGQTREAHLAWLRQHLTRQAREFADSQETTKK